MLEDSLLVFLRCPEDHSPVRAADDAILSQLNAAIRAGKLRNQAGQIVRKAVDGGLVRAAGDLLYPVIDQIPVMIHDEAIPLDQLAKLRN
jgi:uncharacterized protein YbaR (Trm112 family)